MKKPVLTLLALLALLPFAQLLAQTPPVAGPATNSVAPAPDTARFLATLAGGQAIQAPSGLVPAPTFMTNCGYNPPCESGQICCFLCGNPPAEDPDICLGCVTPYKGRCPMVV
ncbi:MAG TPA: hypothetical protein VF173_11655 [Thermoanaerobaculia bacterium]|nr:hypothetical protein [Thermoanaerobaculia bacterium]